FGKNFSIVRLFFEGVTFTQSAEELLVHKASANVMIREGIT
ncbi:MAG: hypothetical protein ACJAUV_001726, partial [Flavobacteriales bacterium]